MLESISFLLNPKQYLDEKFSELKTSLNETISLTLSNKNNSINNSSINELLKLLKIKSPKANLSQLDDVLCWMVENTTNIEKFPVIIKKTSGNIDVNETWRSINDWIEHLSEEKNRALLEVAAAEELIKQAEREAAIKEAEKEVLAKKAAADAALAAAATAAQQAQEATEKLKKIS